jgi:phosphoadenosine phosphosulfate reductase
MPPLVNPDAPKPPVPLPLRPAVLSDDALAQIARGMETWAAEDIVRWSVEAFGPRICATTSAADTVMIHLVHSVAPEVEFVFLDTGFHFPETLATLDRATRRYDLTVRIERPVADAPDLHRTDIDTCCGARKVDTLARAMVGREAWLTGLRRADSPSRADTPILSRNSAGIVKVCPIATWTDTDVDAYIARHELIMNPLLFDGYDSIGCAPCTIRTPVGANGLRAGRWAGSTKTECGIHR